jgi:transglutaminase-like putative cysteine protease
MTILTVLHRTTYRYARPVSFGEHRLMFRPRDSHDLRLIDTGLRISPKASVRWLHDVFGNSVTIARFTDPADELVFESSFRLQHYPLEAQEIELEPYAQRYPFHYAADEIPDLGRAAERHYVDPDHEIDLWARQFLDPTGQADTMGLLMAMTHRIRQEFTYKRRPEMGTRHPVRTLELRSGTCRDYALLMMEAVRSLGLAARFVSGYIYSPYSGADRGRIGGGHTHAWVRVYLPACGWVEFDPTNGIVGNQDLVRVAICRDPRQALPLCGTWMGEASDFLKMDVEVEVRAEEDAAPHRAPRAVAMA